MSELAVIADKLAELSRRLATLARRTEALEVEEAEPREPPGNGSAGRLLSAREVCAITGLGRGQVYRLAREGGLGAVRIGSRSYRVSEAALEDWARRGGLK